jgi:hypothetical protein
MNFMRHDEFLFAWAVRLAVNPMPVLRHPPKGADLGKSGRFSHVTAVRGSSRRRSRLPLHTVAHARRGTDSLGGMVLRALPNVAASQAAAVDGVLLLDPLDAD